MSKTARGSQTVLRRSVWIPISKSRVSEHWSKHTNGNEIVRAKCISSKYSSPTIIGSTTKNFKSGYVKAVRLSNHPQGECRVSQVTHGKLASTGHLLSLVRQSSMTGGKFCRTKRCWRDGHKETAIAEIMVQSSFSFIHGGVIFKPMASTFLWKQDSVITKHCHTASITPVVVSCVFTLLSEINSFTSRIFLRRWFALGFCMTFGIFYLLSRPVPKHHLNGFLQAVPIQWNLLNGMDFDSGANLFSKARHCRDNSFHSALHIVSSKIGNHFPMLILCEAAVK